MLNSLLNCNEITFACADIYAGQNTKAYVHPARYPIFSPNILFSHVTIPPVSGIAPDSSATVSPPHKLIIPAETHASSANPGVALVISSTP